jgi:tetratricopeptide (TPR) repeat protein
MNEIMMKDRINNTDTIFVRSNRYRMAFLFLSIFLIASCSVRSVQIKRAEEYYKKGQGLVSTGEIDRAIINFEKSIRISRDAGFREGIAHNLNELAIIHTGKGEPEKARELLSDAVVIYKELDMKPEVSKAMDNIALTYVKEQRFKEAIDRYNELIEWDKIADNEIGIGITRYNMALIYYQYMGMEDKAKECFIKALIIFKKTGNEEYIQMIQNRLNKSR